MKINFTRSLIYFTLSAALILIGSLSLNIMFNLSLFIIEYNFRVKNYSKYLKAHFFIYNHYYKY